MARRSQNVGIAFHPLTTDRWADLEILFGKNGACGGCWCMYWRLPRKQFVARKGNGNRIALKTIVEKEQPPGILAYHDDRPIGWCAVAPREVYSTLSRSRILAPIDADPVWSISCLFIAKDHRRQGLSVRLLKAAVDFVRDQGGRIVEGYPVEPRGKAMPAAFAWTGLSSAFLQAGFTEAERRSPTRPIMRFHIGKPHRG